MITLALYWAISGTGTKTCTWNTAELLAKLVISNRNSGCPSIRLKLSKHGPNLGLLWVQAYKSIQDFTNTVDVLSKPVMPKSILTWHLVEVYISITCNIAPNPEHVFHKRRRDVLSGATTEEHGSMQGLGKAEPRRSLQLGTTRTLIITVGP